MVKLDIEFVIVYIVQLYSNVQEERSPYWHGLTEKSALQKSGRLHSLLNGHELHKLDIEKFR